MENLKIFRNLLKQVKNLCELPKFKLNLNEIFVSKNL